MILKGSQRGGTRQLGLHLLKTEENEHVEIHEISGFMADDLLGAMREIDLVTKGTRCKQPLFSVSLSPPGTENVRVEVFENAVRMIEERMGLEGQPRMIVFHEKEGRRHAHAVWSRIDAQSMTAKNLSHFKYNLRGIAKQLYLENGWKMPEGYIDSSLRDPRNFTLAEWQQSKRTGVNVREVKAAIRDCYAASDTAQTFKTALEDRGLFLAHGDSRAFVAVSYDGQVFAIARAAQQRAKDVAAKLSALDGLQSVADTIKYIGQAIAPKVSAHIAEAKRLAANQMKPLLKKKEALKTQHREERRKLDEGQKKRQEHETRERAARLSSGFKGVWDRLRGEHAKIIKANQAEAYFALQRDREQRQELVLAQLKERQDLQREIMATREREARQILALHKQSHHYRQMERGELSSDRGSGRGSGTGRGEGGRGTGRGSPTDRGPSLG